MLAKTEDLETVVKLLLIKEKDEKEEREREEDTQEHWTKEKDQKTIKCHKAKAGEACVC